MNETLFEWLVKGGGAAGFFVAGVLFYRWVSKAFWGDIAVEVKAIIVAKKRAVDLILEREEHERLLRERTKSQGSKSEL